MANSEWQQGPVALTPALGSQFAQQSPFCHTFVTIRGDAVIRQKTKVNAGTNRGSGEGQNGMINTQNGGRPNIGAISGDLSRRLGERALLGMVLEAVQSVDSKVLEDGGGSAPGFRPRMMLTLLTYSYATSLFGSRDIEAAIGNDALIRYICARTYPCWQVIRRFRRMYKEPIRQCLVHVLRQAWTCRFDEGEADYVGYEWFETAFAEQVHVAVNDRLETAALMDGADSD